MRVSVAIALIPLLIGFSNDELALLSGGLDSNPGDAPFNKFADRIPEAKAVCSFLPKIAALSLPAIP